MEAVRVEANLCGVVEEDADSFVAEAVAKTVLRGVIYPLLDPDLVISWLDDIACTSCLLASHAARSRGTITSSAHGVPTRHLIVAADWSGLSWVAHLIWLDVTWIGRQELSDVS